MLLRKSFLVFLVSLILMTSGCVSPSASRAGQQPRLSLGSRGQSVTQLQDLLKTAGFYLGQPSGYFGLTTVVALSGFQSAHHLSVNGVAGAAEWGALESLPASAAGDVVLGYYVNDYPGDTASYNSVLQFGGDSNYTATVSYEANSDGSLSGEVPLQGLDEIKASGSKPLLLVNNIGTGGIDAWSMHALLSSATAQQAFFGNVLNLLGEYGYKGVNIDFESIWPQDRQLFSTFLGELKARLASGDYILAVAVPAKTYDQPNDAWSGAYDYAAIGKAADLVELMSYDEHWYGGTPGPVAALPWVENVLSYACSTMPSDKILLGIAAYGYDWSRVNTSVVEWKQAGQLTGLGTVKWDQASDSPYLQYYSGGVEHVVWFENAESLAMKLKLVSQYHIDGIAFWRLGYENAGFWSVVDTYLR